jgi:hypothetical protein
MQKINDNKFDSQALIDLINSINIASGIKQEYFYFCYEEPSDKIKGILKDFGIEYKIIPNSFVSDLNVDDNTAFIFPKHESYIKLEFD